MDLLSQWLCSAPQTFETDAGLQEPVASSLQGPKAWSGLHRHSVTLKGVGAGGLALDEVVDVLLLVELLVTVVTVVVVAVGVHKLHAARHATANAW